MDINALKNLQKQREFFVGIDSDGCVFDSMEIKHKECFIPNIINFWDLQAVSRLARETAEFVNLYSHWRGINRWPALIRVFDLLAQRPDALERGYKVLEVKSLREWIQREKALGNPALAKEVQRTGDAVLQKALEWSKAVNADVEKIVRNVPPFPHVRASLEKLQGFADVAVVSQTPTEALQREWAEHDIAKYARIICGQEMGSKSEHLKFGAGGKYDGDRILMIGDAPGDLKAARDNDALFFPINPGRESESWKRFYEEGIERLQKSTFRGPYEDDLIKEFLACLPQTPPWKTT